MGLAMRDSGFLGYFVLRGWNKQSLLKKLEGEREGVQFEGIGDGKGIHSSFYTTAIRRDREKIVFWAELPSVQLRVRLHVHDKGKGGMEHCLRFEWRRPARPKVGT